MKPRFALSFGLSAWLFWTGFSEPASTATAVPGDPVRAAEEFVAAMARDDFSGAVGRFDTTMKRALPETKLREVWATLAVQSGQFRQTLGTRTMSQAGFDIVFVTCEFERAIVDVKAVIGPGGQLSGLWFLPAERPNPDTASPRSLPSTVREQAVSVGDDEWALPGTISWPAAGSGPWPAVVLVHGSGPNDQDETVGVCKPFRDLAWGLAARGIAVLRYDKGTKVHPERFRTMPGLTVKEEIIDDALRALDRLRRTDGIATNRTFVLGHSLGGTVAPRIAQADPGIAGVIILAGSTRPLEELIVEQTRYLLALDGGLSTDDQAKLSELQAEVTKVKQVTEAGSNAPILGAPKSYWLDLRGYNAVTTARKLRQPLLILHGGRDYQVTEVDFDGWKEGLTGRTNVTFKLFPELNHLFIAGEGKSRPAEYEQPGRVAEDVLDEIAHWIAR